MYPFLKKSTSCLSGGLMERLVFNSRIILMCVLFISLYTTQQMDPIIIRPNSTYVDDQKL
ncbi:hypothetical protein QTP88_025332 [Uroleucon formosanum]